jgi:hypothetical protein
LHAAAAAYFAFSIWVTNLNQENKDLVWNHHPLCTQIVVGTQATVGHNHAFDLILITKLLFYNSSV